MALHKKKARSRRYPAQTITGADYADEISLLANTPTQAESPLNSLEQSEGGIGLHVNADKTEYMYFIKTLNGSSLKLADKFAYLGSCILLNKSDISMHLAKAWTTIDRLSII